MTASAQVLRLLGFIVMALGAWHHAPLAILGGSAVVLAAWLKGLVRH